MIITREYKRKYIKPTMFCTHISATDLGLWYYCWCCRYYAFITISITVTFTVGILLVSNYINSPTSLNLFQFYWQNRHFHKPMTFTYTKQCHKHHIQQAEMVILLSKANPTNKQTLRSISTIILTS